MTLTINSGFDLTCLGVINFVVRNKATILFGNGANDRLTLAEGSSIIINTGGNIDGGGQCNASDRIYVGTNLVSTCNGQAGTDASFSDVISLGGTGTAFSNSPVCVGSSINLTATPPPNGAFTYAWTGPNSFTSTLQNPAFIASSTAYDGDYKVTMTRQSDGKVTYGYITVVVGASITPTLSSNDADNSFCAGTSVTFTAGGGTSYNFKVDGVSIQNGTAVTYTTSTLTNGQIVTVTVSNGSCSVTSSGITNTVNVQPSAPSVGAITHPSCTTSKGSVVLSGLPSGTWDLYLDNTGSPLVSGQTGSSYVVTELASGTHHFNVINGSCLSPKSIDVVINNPPATKTWTGTDWSPTGEPTIENKVMFVGNYTSTDNLEACSCDVKNNANVVINSGHTLKVTNEVKVDSDSSLTFENNASLVQVNDLAVNSGNIIYKRNTTAIFNTDYVYWSSPVAGFTLGGIQTGTLYYSFNAAGNSWVRGSSSTVMTAGKGYIVRGAGTGLTTGTPFVKTVTFSGQPNNGVITTAIGGANTSNLIGNPYPSAIDADAFLLANKDVLEGTLYFWIHNTAIQLAANIANGTAGSGTYAYTSDDYAIYNRTGGTTTVGGAAVHNGKIAAGQGFMATGFAVGNAVFNNSMRLGAGGTVLNNSQFFKQTQTLKTADSVEKNRIWLNLTNAQGAFKQTLVGYITGATNAYDRAYDGVSYNANKFVDFYSVNEGKNLIIQGRALPFDKTDEVPLGYSITVAGDYTISIDNTDGLLKDQKVFLEDKLLGTIHNLRLGSYTFTTNKGTFKERFALVYRNKNEVIEEEVIPVGTEVLVSVKNRVITIYSPVKLIDKVVIYDVSGKKIYQEEKVNLNELEILHLQSVHQVVIVTAVLEDKTRVTKKIMY
jgi:hypothetical protein